MYLAFLKPHWRLFVAFFAFIKWLTYFRFHCVLSRGLFPHFQVHRKCLYIGGQFNSPSVVVYFYGKRPAAYPRVQSSGGRRENTLFICYFHSAAAIAARLNINQCTLLRRCIDLATRVSHPFSGVGRCFISRPVFLLHHHTHQQQYTGGGGWWWMEMNGICKSDLPIAVFGPHPTSNKLPQFTTERRRHFSHSTAVV